VNSRDQHIHLYVGEAKSGRLDHKRDDAVVVAGFERPSFFHACGELLRPLFFGGDI
jgi:hypothetical protein